MLESLSQIAQQEGMLGEISTGMIIGMMLGPAAQENTLVLRSNALAVAGFIPALRSQHVPDDPKEPTSAVDSAAPRTRGAGALLVALLVLLLSGGGAPDLTGAASEERR